MVFQLSTKYSAIPKVSGIYFIGCHSNKKMYVGSSNNIRRRLRRHIYELKKESHPNEHLFRAFKKYGIDSFTCGIIDLCEPDKLLVEEERWIKELEVTDSSKGFNKQIKPNSSLNTSIRGKVVQLDKNLEIVKVHKSMAIAARSTGLSISNIDRVIKGRGITAGGFYWCKHDKLNTFCPKSPNYPSKISAKRRDNVFKATRKHKYRLPKYPILQYSREGDFIKEWMVNIPRLADILHINKACLDRCLGKHSNREITGGYKWRYKNALLIPEKTEKQ